VTLVRLTVVDTEAEADLLCALLRTEGIACDHRPTGPSARLEARVFTNWREVLVDEADVEHARSLLPDRRETADAGRDLARRAWHVAVVLAIVVAIVLYALWDQRNLP
jgi:hypothetical protein